MKKNINKIKKYDILMKEKNFNIMSPLLYIIYNWHSSPIVLIWTNNIRNMHCVNIIYYF